MSAVRRRGATLARAACVLLASAFATSAAAEAQDRGLAILDEAALRYEGVSTLCADFVQVLSVPLLGDERTGAGRVCQARPNLFAMRFTDPDGDLIVVDGTDAWVYYRSVDPKQVLRAPAEDSAGGLDFHREFLVDADEKFDVMYEADEQVGSAHTHRLRMVPKSRAGYRAAVVWIDVGEPLLRQVRIEEASGSRRTITLSGIEFEATPGEEWFRFTPPAGALVIRG